MNNDCKRSCATCFFSSAAGMIPHQLKQQYACHFFPPGWTLFLSQRGLEGTGTLAPMMNADQWCAQYRPKDAAAPAWLWTPPTDGTIVPANTPAKSSK